MKNLLGRLHARSDDQRERIAALWCVPVFGTDSSHHIARIYRTLNDIRAVRDTWQLLSPLQQRIIRALVPDSSTQLTISELAAQLGEEHDLVHAAAAELFFWGILATDDGVELPVGEQPQVFVPTELNRIFRNLLEEQQIGDQSGYSLRSLLETRDDLALETTATKWGVRVVPGVKRREDLITEILDAIVTPGRLSHVISQLKQPATELWRAMQESDGPRPLADVVDEAGLTVAEAPLGLQIEHSHRLRGALEAVESSLLVCHTWLGDGSRALFIPEELRNPHELPVRMPLATMDPLPPESVPEPIPMHPFALAWDVLSVLREIAAKGPPVWVPGRELSSHWLRMVNGRLWYRGESEPQVGYAALLLYLALGVGVLEPAPRTPGMEKGAIKPVIGRNLRWWRDLSFAEQIERLRQHWLGAETWIEGRESGEIEIRGADWVRFRHRLLVSVARMDPDTWVLVHEASARLAQQDPMILGDYFQVAQGRPETRQRATAIAIAIEVELRTAFTWFGFVETVDMGTSGIAIRVTESAALAAREIDAMPAIAQPSHPHVLDVNHEGTIQLHRPSPVDIWSVTTFAESEQLWPKAIYQLRQQSIATALGAGFDLGQITHYLEQRSGAPLPDPLERRLREWTASYKRVKLRRAVVLELDIQIGLQKLAEILIEAGFEVIQPVQERVMVMLPETGDDGASAEQQLAAVLRKAGYVGMWVKAREL